MKSPLKNLFRLLLAMIGMSGCDKGPPTLSLEHLVGTSLLKSPPLLVTGTTDRRFLASFDGHLYAFDLDGHPVGDPLPIPFILREIFETPSGALAVGREGLLPIDHDGMSLPPVKFPRVGEGMYWAFAMGDERILIARAGMNKELTAEFYRTDGQHYGEPVVLSRPKLGTVLAAAAFGIGNFVMVWEEERSLYATILSDEGQVIKPPYQIYTVGRGGALQRAFAQTQASGSVLLTWQDSTPGPWSVMTLVIHPDGKVDVAFRLNHEEKTDTTRVTLPQEGQGQWVAWISGTHWGQFSVSGQGSVVLQGLKNKNPNLIFQAKGGIDAFSMAMKDEKAFVVGAVRQASPQDQTLGYNVFSGLASLASSPNQK